MHSVRRVVLLAILAGMTTRLTECIAFPRGGLLRRCVQNRSRWRLAATYLRGSGPIDVVGSAPRAITTIRHTLGSTLRTQIRIPGPRPAPNHPAGCGKEPRRAAIRPTPFGRIRHAARWTRLHARVSRQAASRARARLRRGVSHLARRWSGRRGSNSRHSAWKADALPTELLPPEDAQTISPGAARAGRVTC